MMVSASQAAITISGTVGTLFKAADGTTSIPSGSLFLVIADDGQSGFLKDNGSLQPAVSASINGLTTSSDPKVVAANAAITAGLTFGGDRILATGTNTSAGVLPTLLSAVSIAGYESKKFAVIWFAKSAATLTSEGLSGQQYGIISGADWTLPSSDSGTFTMSSTDATPSTNYFSFSSAITSAQVGSTGFFTGTGTAGDATNDVKSATFKIVPEPSSAILAALGALGLLRRRRA